MLYYYFIILFAVLFFDFARSITTTYKYNY